MRRAGPGRRAPRGRSRARRCCRLDFPNDRAPRRAPAISFGGTRTTRSPHATSKRSRPRLTLRTSSNAHRRSALRFLAQPSSSCDPSRRAAAVSSSTSSPVPDRTATAVCVCLCGSTPITTVTASPSLTPNGVRAPADRPQSGQGPRSSQVTLEILERRRATAPSAGQPHKGATAGPRVSPPPAQGPNTAPGRQQASTHRVGHIHQPRPRFKDDIEAGPLSQPAATVCIHDPPEDTTRATSECRNAR